MGQAEEDCCTGIPFGETSMRSRRFILGALLSFGLLAACTQQQQSQTASAHRFFHVQLAGNETQPVSGRLILFAEEAGAAKADTKDGKVTEVDANPFHPTQTAIAAQEVDRLAPGQTIDIDADMRAFPDAWSKLPPGDYLVQAVLD